MWGLHRERGSICVQLAPESRYLSQAEKEYRIPSREQNNKVLKISAFYLYKEKSFVTKKIVAC